MLSFTDIERVAFTGFLVLDEAPWRTEALISYVCAFYLSRKL